jgi:hypothetical protein
MCRCAQLAPRVCNGCALLIDAPIQAQAKLSSLMSAQTEAVIAWRYLRAASGTLKKLQIFDEYRPDIYAAVTLYAKSTRCSLGGFLGRLKTHFYAAWTHIGSRTPRCSFRASGSRSRWAAKRRHILRSNAGFKTVHTFSNSLDPEQTFIILYMTMS